MIRILIALLFCFSLVACGDDTSPTDTGVGDTSAGDTGMGDTSPTDTGAGDTGAGDTGVGDSGVMCIALGAECDGTVPCCAPNVCEGAMCEAPRDGGGDAASGDGGA